MPRALSLLLLAVACGDAPDVGLPASIPAPCDPLDPALCALPFPSSHWLVAADTPTGRRVALDEDALPTNRDGVRMPPTFWNERDGFSINSAMLFYAADVDLTGDGLPTHLDIGAYADPDARIVVVNAATGERHPIWVEVDGTAPSDDQRLVTIRPALPFAWNTTYVVGVRGLSDSTGAPIVPSSAFAALRDGGDHDDPTVDARRASFDAVVFPALEAEGFARAELQLAWDFHTASREGTLGRTEHVRDDALAWVDEQGGLDVTIDEVVDHDCDAGGEAIFRDLRGRFTLPLYLEGDGPENFDDDVLQGVFTRGDDGLPYRNGTSEADFLVRIPCSVARGDAAAPVVQFGHGLFGRKEDADAGWLADLANEQGWIVFAMDWSGMSRDDVVPITFMLASSSEDGLGPGDFAMVPERSQQGFVEQLLGTRAVKTALADHEALQLDGRKLIDPDHVWLYGESAGAILGSALLALSTDLERGILNCGGGPFSLLLPRSSNFDQFFALLRNKYDDHREITLFVAGLTQQLWDPGEGAGWAWEMARDATRPKQVLQHTAIYDNQVSSLGAAYLARAYGSVLLQTPVRPIWGVDAVDAGDGVEGNVLVEWKYTDLPDEPFASVPPGSKGTVPPGYGDDLNPHTCPKGQEDAQAQVVSFFETGRIPQTCAGGVCTATLAGDCR